MARHITASLLLLGLFCPGLTLAQGLLVVTDPSQSVRLPRPMPTPSPAATYCIKALDVNVQLVDQVARVNVSQTFANTGSSPLEVSFIFPLPYDGAIERLTLMIDGREHPAQLLAADEARKIYEEIVRKNQDPALLEWMGRGMFKTSVFPVPPGEERKVTLQYTQVCANDQGLTDFLFPLSTARYTSQPVEKVTLRANIESAVDIKNVYSPTHDIQVERPDARHATVKFDGEKLIPTEDFRLFYDTEAGKIGTSLVSYRPEGEDDGYFLLLASPQIAAVAEERPAKTVVFVIDRSGSMSGEKIEQAKAALKFVLNSLRPGDLFNIVAYDDAVETFRPELQKFDDDTRAAALGFAEGIFAGGSTNIDAALRTTLEQLTDSSRPSYVLFLTDGQPTAGEQNEAKLVEIAKNANQVRARIFAFGLGYDVNSRLLDKLVRGNFGQSVYVRPDEDIESHVSRLYNRIESPVLTDVQIEFAFDTESAADAPAPVTRTYPQAPYDLFAGEQLIVVGRYRQAGAAKVTIRGSVDGQSQEYEFPVEFVDRSNDEKYAFAEKLWAVRRVGELIDQIDLQGQNEELVKELVELSKRHGILTPYTSFLADENTNLNDMAANRGRAVKELEGLNETAGQSAFEQREMKQAFQSTARASATPGLYFSNGSADGDVAVPAQQSMRQMGNKVFYRRDARWVDSSVNETQEQNAVRIVQFSDEYFRLARAQRGQLSQYLVSDEPLLVNLQGQTYLIEPPSK